eukprot:gene11601-8269_t
MLIAKAKLPKSVVRFSMTHNECIFARRNFIWRWDPLNLNSLDNDDGDTQEVPDDEEIEAWIADANNVPDNSDITYTDGYRTWVKKRQDFEDGRRTFTANIDLSLSPASRIHIRAHHLQEWNEAMNDEDPFEALQIIKQSHAVLGGATATLNDFEHARKGVTEATQAPSESLADFKERFTRLVATARTVGVTEVRLTNTETVYHFIRGVTDKKAAFIKQDLINRHAVYPAMFPQSVEVAHGLIAASVRAIADLDHEEPRQAIAKVAKSKSDKPNDREKPRCWHCKRTGHTAEQCRALLRIIREHRPSQSPKAKRGTPPKRVQFKAAPRKRTRDDADDSDAHSNASDDTRFMYGDSRKKGKNTPKSALVTVVNAVTASNDDVIVILDTGANCHIVNNANALTDVDNSTPTVIVQGVGNNITATSQGQAGPFGTALLVPSSPYNILAFGQLAKTFDISYDQFDNSFDIRDKTRTLIGKFIKSTDDLYVLHGTESDTVAAFLSRLTHRKTANPAHKVIITPADRDRANKAKELHEALGHPNDEALIALLRHQGIRDCILQPRDVRNYRRLHGPCPQCVKGKATIQKVSHHPPTPPPYVGHTYHADIMFVGNAPHLRICEGATKYGSLIPMERKQSTTLLAKLTILFGQMRALINVEPRILRTDNETTFTAISDQLAAMGILLQQSPSGNHAATIERQIRADRDAYRTLTESLPYPMPSSLTSAAMQDVVRVRNFVPNTATGGVCPAALITGRTPTMDDIAMPWGTIVYATNPNSASDKALPKADLGIIVAHHLESKAGSVDILVLEHGRLRTVNRPSRLIRRCRSVDDIQKATSVINSLAKNQPLPCSGTDATTNAIVPESTTILRDDKPQVVIDTRPAKPRNAGVPTTHSPPVPPPRTTPSTAPPPSATTEPTQSPSAPPTATNPTQAPIVPSRALRDRTNLRRPRRYAFNISVKKALTQYGDAAKAAIAEEFRSLIEKKVWTPLRSIKHARQSKHCRILPCSMFIKEKLTPDGTFERLKARLVAGGHRTDKDLYSHDEKAADTVKNESLMTVLSVASYQSRNIETMDFPTAYLNGQLQNTQVMRLDHTLASILVDLDPSYSEYMQENGTILVNLHGALYGLPEAGKIWFEKLRNSILKIGFKQAAEDPCVFNKTNVHQDAKGHSGRVICVGREGTPVLVKSQKQRLVARSSTESELISLADCVSDVLWSQRLLEFLVPNVRMPTIYQDNQSTIHMAKLGHGGKTGNSKHISTRYFFIKQHLDQRELAIEYLLTQDMTADLLTKPLGGHLFHHLCEKLIFAGSTAPNKDHK